MSDPRLGWLSTSALLPALPPGPLGAPTLALSNDAVGAALPQVSAMPPQTAVLAAPGQDVPRARVGATGLVKTMGLPLEERVALLGQRLGQAVLQGSQGLSKSLATLGSFFDRLSGRPALAFAVAGNQTVGAARLQAHQPYLMMQGEPEGQRPRVPTPASARANRPVVYAPPFWRRVLGVVVAAHGIFPLMVGLMGPSGDFGLAAAPTTLALAVGAALIGTGLLILGPSLFRPVAPDEKVPNEGPFVGFTLAVAGFWNSTAIAEWLMTGAVTGNTWILGALYAGVAVVMLGLDAMKDVCRRQPATGMARAFSSGLLFAGYVGAVATMILLRDWHNGLGVLVGFGGLACVMALSLWLPSLIAWIGARMPNGVPGPVQAKEPGRAWVYLATHRQQAIWGSFALGAVVALASLLLHGSAWFALAPVVGVLLGHFVHERAKRVLATQR